VVGNLSTGYKIVQSSHALAEFAFKYQEEFEAWRLGSNYLCCLEISRKNLFRLIDKLEMLGIKYSAFFEPDIGGEITAIAVTCLPPEVHKPLFRNLKLSS
jgi:hypothetical protein